MRLEDTIIKIGKELDSDILEWMLAESGEYKNWELIPDPVLTMFEWQKVRNIAKANKPFSGIDYFPTSS